MSLGATAGTMGAIVALRRLRARTVLAIAVATVMFATLGAYAERLTAHGDAVGRALQGPLFGLAIPIATLSIVTIVFGRGRMDDALTPIALLGGSRRIAAVGAVMGAAVVGGLLAMITAGATALVAHGSTGAAQLLDAASCAGIGGLTAACYAGYYGAASTYGRRGGGRVIALLADLVVGPMTGLTAVIFPRAHALNLLGAEPVLGWPQSASVASLVVLMALFVALGSARIRP